MNYSKIISSEDRMDNFAPRKLFDDCTARNPDTNDTDWTKLTLFMTDREKEIQLGTSWNHAPLKQGECIMS